MTVVNLEGGPKGSGTPQQWFNKESGPMGVGKGNLMTLNSLQPLLSHPLPLAFWRYALTASTIPDLKGLCQLFLITLKKAKSHIQIDKQLQIMVKSVQFRETITSVVKLNKHLCPWMASMEMVYKLKIFDHFSLHILDMHLAKKLTTCRGLLSVQKFTYCCFSFFCGRDGTSS